MTDIVDFIRARLAEDMRAAMAARSDAGEHWEPDNLHIDLADDADVDDACFATHAVAQHVARQDPGRTLRTVAVKRRLLTAHARSHECVKPPDDGEGAALDGRIWDSWGWNGSRPCFVIRCLASEFATHKDYRPEWKP